MLQAERSRVRNMMRSMTFSNGIIIPAALDPEVYTASNRNEYQKQKNVSEEQSAAGA
jgi:hypothetical protein